MYYYERRDFDSVSRTYRQKDLEAEIVRAERKLKEGQENIDKYIAACREQLRKIDAAQFKKHVYLRRYKPWLGKVDLFVGVCHYPDIEDGEKFSWTTDSERFGGTERKAAREYARELASRYGCEIREEGF